jgi:hypothetical protein
MRSIVMNLMHAAFQSSDRQQIRDQLNCWPENKLNGQYTRSTTNQLSRGRLHPHLVERTMKQPEQLWIGS